MSPLSHSEIYSNYVYYMYKTQELWINIHFAAGWCICLIYCLYAIVKLTYNYSTVFGGCDQIFIKLMIGAHSQIVLNSY